MQRARAIDAFVMWAISIVLAGIFLLAGVPKLLGIEPVGLQAAAMVGFPAWIRVAVGLVETLCGIGLLLPSIATPSALLLAAAMIPATITQFVSGEGNTLVPLVVLAALLLLAWRRNAKLVSDGYHGFAGMPHPLLFDGVVAGFIGAVAIVLWFLVVDLLAGRPFFTPATLGRGLLGVIAPGASYATETAFVLLYTVFHFAAFMIVGLVASLVVTVARKEPSILFAFVLLFAISEVGVYALVSILDVATPLGRHAWLQVMLGNLIAALAMGTYFWRRHRELGDEFRHSLDWETSIVPPSDEGPAGPVISPPNVLTPPRPDSPAGTPKPL
jgi:putative oxidoreductase